MTIGTMLRQWLVKLEWFSTLFPRIPVPIQQKIQKHLEVSVICYVCSAVISFFIFIIHMPKY